MKISVDCYVFTWDWKDMAPIGDIIQAIVEFKDKYGEVDWHDIQTGSDQYAVIISPGAITKELAEFLYEIRYNLEKYEDEQKG